MPIRSLAVVVATAAAFALAGPAAAQTPAPADAGDFVVEFGAFKKANRSAGAILRRSGAMEAVAAKVNSRWALPQDIPVLFSDEIEVGPAFIPDVPLGDGTELTFINVPGTFLSLELKAMRRELKGAGGLSPNAALVYANEFILAHEMGHALVHQLNLPITGREEDAVDGFAAYLLADDPQFGPMTAISSAIFFDAYSRVRGELRQEDFADEHSILEQRVYQFLCWVYGSDPAQFKSLVGKGLLPKSRAMRCPAEWAQVTSAWDTLLAPYALPVTGG